MGAINTVDSTGQVSGIRYQVYLTAEELLLLGLVQANTPFTWIIGAIEFLSEFAFAAALVL